MSAALPNPGNAPEGREVVVLGGGCFWCLEAVYLELAGVESVLSGYAGGETKNPTYGEVCSGTTGHAEVVRVVFDPSIVPLEDVLRVFFTIHDPTTLNRQGADVGTQYRSAIFYRDEAQRETARTILREVEVAGIWDGRLVTQLAPLEEFYAAEEYHQRYFERNPQQAYCRVVVAPKVLKFREKFADRVKSK